jgi:hypothetical protein
MVSLKASIAKFMPQNFNDFMAVLLVLLIAVMWIIQGIHLIALRDDVNGALTVLFTLVVQYYFRKKASE